MFRSRILTCNRVSKTLVKFSLTFPELIPNTDLFVTPIVLFDFFFFLTFAIFQSICTC